MAAGNFFSSLLPISKQRYTYNGTVSYILAHAVKDPILHYNKA
jgi:hypothetical protein